MKDQDLMPSIDRWARRKGYRYRRKHAPEIIWSGEEALLVRMPPRYGKRMVYCVYRKWLIATWSRPERNSLAEFAKLSLPEAVKRRAFYPVMVYEPGMGVYANRRFGKKLLADLIEDARGLEKNFDGQLEAETELYEKKHAPAVWLNDQLREAFDGEVQGDRTVGCDMLVRSDDNSWAPAVSFTACYSVSNGYKTTLRLNRLTREEVVEAISYVADLFARRNLTPMEARRG